MATARERLDQVLVSRGLAESRAQAQALILAGRVRVEGQVSDKPGRAVARDAPVEVEADTRTRRYMAAVIRGVKVGPSPDWMVRRLAAVGVRSISNVVDVSNRVSVIDTLTYLTADEIEVEGVPRRIVSGEVSVRPVRC